jgi:hypothetical protein
VSRKTVWDRLRHNSFKEGDPPPETLKELSDLYCKVMGDPTDFSTGKFIVRQFDGMDGCWCDLPEATNVTGEVALRAWSAKTERGTKRVRFDEIDYYRIFPSDTRMKWDGSEGREMFR